MSMHVGIQKGYRVPVSPFRSVFVSFKPYQWRCECEDFSMFRQAGYECRHIVAVKTWLRTQEVQMQDTVGLSEVR